MNNKVKELPTNRQTDPLLSEKKEGTGVFIPKSILFDLRLSPKAKGLLSIILALPEHRSISVEGLCKTSHQIGKKSIQSGVKELTQNGYLKLVPIYDGKGKFRGRQYEIVKAVVFGRKAAPFRKILKGGFPVQGAAPFRKFLKQESPKKAFSNDLGANSLEINGQPQNRIFLKQESPKSGSIISVVDELNINKQQQQQQIKDDTKTGFSITHFFFALEKSEAWQSAFVGQVLSDRTLLTVAQLGLLLQHFKQTSLRSGVVYSNLAAVQKHFSNWYHFHLSHRSLVGYIQQQQSAHGYTRKQAFELAKHSENIFKKLKSRGYSSSSEVEKALAALQKHRGIYEATIPFLPKPKDVAFLQMLVENVGKIVGKVQQAQAEGRLGWFCH